MKLPNRIHVSKLDCNLLINQRINIVKVHRKPMHGPLRNSLFSFMLTSIPVNMVDPLEYSEEL